GGLDLGAVHDDDEAPLAGDVEGVDPEDLAGPPHLFARGNGPLVDDDGHVGSAGHLVQDGGHPAAGGVTHHAHAGRGVEEHTDELGEGGGVGLDVALDVEFAPGEHDGHAVVADRTGHEHGIAGAHGGRPQRDVPLDDPDAGGVDVHAVTLPPPDDLGVPGDDLDARHRSGDGHRVGDPLEVG